LLFSGKVSSRDEGALLFLWAIRGDCKHIPSSKAWEMVKEVLMGGSVKMIPEAGYTEDAK
jgi:hypothetical protein